MNEQGLSRRIVTRLVDAGLVEAHRAEEAVAIVDREFAQPAAGDVPGGTPEGSRQTGPRLTEVIAYAGAALVVVAVILLGSQYWGDLTAPQRSLILGGIAAVLLGGGAVIVRVAGGAWLLRERLGPRPRFLAGTLVIAAAIAAGVALGSWIEHANYPPPTYDLHNVSMTSGVALALALLALGYVLAPSPLLHVALAVAGVVLLMGVWTGEGYAAEILRAVLILAVAILWLVLSLLRRWAEPQAGGAVGALLLFLGAQMLLSHPEPRWAHAVTLAVALVLFALYWWRGWWPFLAVGVIALTAAVTEALIEWTDGSLGAGGATLIAGLVLLAASGGAVLLRQRRGRPVRPSTPEQVTDGPAAP